MSSLETIKYQEEMLRSGHLACPGCGGSLAMRYVLKTLGKKTMLVVPACCWSIIAGPYPLSSVKVPLYHTAFETAAVVASGIKAGLVAQGDTETTVVAWAGDGGTFDIGIQALSGAAERNDDIIYICYDNEAYMNTGIQRSSATPKGAWTTTTPETAPEPNEKKDLDRIIAAHLVPYQATLNMAFLDDFVAKVEKAKQTSGFRFLHIFSPCPPGWKMADDMTIEISRLAVHSKLFPLYEMRNGANLSITVEPKGIPVKEYLRHQGRFSHLKDEDIETIQTTVDRRWDELRKTAEDCA